MMKSVDQAPRETCGCGPHLFLPARVELVAAFAAWTSVFAATRPHFCAFYSPRALAAETKTRPPRTGGKADFRNVLRSYAGLLNRYTESRFTNYELRFTSHQSRSLRPRLVRSRDRFPHRRVGLHIFHPVIIHDTEMTRAERFGHCLRHERFGLDNFCAHLLCPRPHLLLDCHCRGATHLRFRLSDAFVGIGLFGLQLRADIVAHIDISNVD